MKKCFLCVAVAAAMVAVSACGNNSSKEVEAVEADLEQVEEQVEAAADTLAKVAEEVVEAIAE